PLRPHLDGATPLAASYTLSLHDALPICQGQLQNERLVPFQALAGGPDVSHVLRTVDLGQGLDDPEQFLAGAQLGGQRVRQIFGPDRKSTRLNSSHVSISYAVFCLKKKT